MSAPTPLQDGDVLRLGDTLLVFVANPPDDLEDDPRLVGSSAAASALRRALDRVARTDTTVLLTGETGTGKEVAARYLHQRSGREGPFVAVNCAALSPTVLESELFGHRRGSFTGAVEDSPGLFKAAHGGTLDEIGELAAPFQAKLLRVLETGRIRPVGGSKQLEVNTRVVAATNRDLLDDVRSGRFRADLYGRLFQWPIVLPPLRERRDDIPQLIQHALANGRRGASRPLHPDLAEALLLHEWPLNVRGLVNVVGIASIASADGGPLMMGPEIGKALELGRIIGEELSEPSMAAPPTDQQVDEALHLHRGRVAAAARALGLSRQQLYRWLTATGRSADDYRD
jgi:DNA-binding NtrC family response regulator